MESKKISFGFSKISKKPNLLPTKENDKTVKKLELIKCLEGQEIKLVEEKPEEKPLTIPLKGLQKTSTALASLLKRRAILLGEDEPEETNCSTNEPPISANNDEPEDIDKQAARELLAEIQKNGSADPANNLILPIVKPDDLPLDGAKESTLNDYENIPIQDFGKAMLRGMGWTEPVPKANKKIGPPKEDTPMVRPKGMGLGADKALSKKTFLVAPEANEVLEIKRGAFVRILGGKHKDIYGQIEGFDDHAGRVIVKFAIGGAKESFNEFLCQPVSRKEYGQYGKCINSSKYDEYKKKENEYGQIILEKDDKDFMEKNGKFFKKERQDSFNETKREFPDDFKRSDRYKYHKEVKDIKLEKYIREKKEENRRRVDHEYDTKNQTRDDVQETSRNVNRDKRDDVRNHGRKYVDRSPSHNFKDDQRYKRREDNKNDVVKEEIYRNSRSCERSTNKKDKDKQRKHERVISDSESDSNYNKHKKSHSKKKSKKSKKSKSKYKDTSSDTEITSCSSESSSESEEKRTKKHKKKTKKSKKQRERSRSRGRR